MRLHRVGRWFAPLQPSREPEGGEIDISHWKKRSIEVIDR